MTKELIVPTLGESITEATVSKWLKKIGEPFEADDPLVEIETDKITLEVPAPSSGVLSEITKILARNKISVKRIIQTPANKNKIATIVIITHKTREKNSNSCLHIFKKNTNIVKKPTLIRLFN